MSPTIGGNKVSECTHCRSTGEKHEEWCMFYFYNKEYIEAQDKKATLDYKEDENE